MKFSFMSFSCPEADTKEFVGIAKRYGFDGIEPRIDAGHRHGIEPGAKPSFLRDAKQMAAENGIKICCVATSCAFANPENADENIVRAKQAIELASELEAPAIRVFGGGIPQGVKREKSLDSVVGALTKLSDHAASHKVCLCLETHDDWTDPAWVAKIMRGVSSDSVAVNWDIMHPVLSAGYTIGDAFQAIKDWIRHVHVHDGVYGDSGLKLTPIGEGGVDHAAALQLLRDLDYDGFVSGEWIAWEPYEIHLPRELAKLKSLV